MARGLIASPNTKSLLILTSIFPTGLLSKYAKHCLYRPPSVSTLLLKRVPIAPSSARFLCSCSQSHQHGPEKDMSRYRETFARRMDMAGLKRHHRIAIGVSGGPDSMALCVLAAMWKRDGHRAIAAAESSEFIDGLVAIVVDHGLRAESKDEANLVCNRVTNMGIRCEIAECEWSEGRPKQGHLQEAARDKRYQLLQDVCIKHQIGVLLIAHHADDQAELFILRLSRGSGVLGLSGMAFISQLFPKFTDYYSEALSWPGILLVRPLLEFSKEDMYQICQGDNQEWVEDSTNHSPLFARNRIRMTLNSLSSSVLRAELLAVISACQKTRLHVDRICVELMNQAVTIMPEGYAIINLKILDPSKVDDICLSKFLALVLQFISQRHRPIRGSASKLLLDYIRTSPCKTSLTAAGCYLCPAPGSKGSKVVVCYSVDSNVPWKMKIIQADSNERYRSVSTEVEQIVENAKSSLDSYLSRFSDVQLLGLTASRFLGLKSSECVLTEAKRLHILSNFTYDTIVSLQNRESEYFKPKTEVMFDPDVKDEGKLVSMTSHREMFPGQVSYFMNRFLIRWNHCTKIPNLVSFNENECDEVLEVGREQYCRSCLVDHDYVSEVRCMVDSDWLYLANLSKSHNVESSSGQLLTAAETQEEAEKIKPWLEFVRLSAQRALLSLKSVPVSARRSLPVLVDSRGLLLSIPSVRFQQCPCMVVSAKFKPRVPLGGGHSLFL